MQDIIETRLKNAEAAYQDFQFARRYWPSEAGDWKVDGDTFTRSISILRDAEEDIYIEGEFGVSFPPGQPEPDQHWANVGRADISRDGNSVKKRHRRGYQVPQDLTGRRIDAAEEAYLDFEFADGLLPCDEDAWKYAGSDRLTRVFYISGGEEDDDRPGEFQVSFELASDSVIGSTATLNGRDIAYRPRPGRSISRPLVSDGFVRSHMDC